MSGLNHCWREQEECGGAFVVLAISVFLLVCFGALIAAPLGVFLFFTRDLRDSSFLSVCCLISFPCFLGKNLLCLLSFLDVTRDCCVSCTPSLVIPMSPSFSLAAVSYLPVFLAYPCPYGLAALGGAALTWRPCDFT